MVLTHAILKVLRCFPAQILVLPPQQGQGIGKSLLEAVYSVADSCNALDITVRRIARLERWMSSLTMTCTAMFGMSQSVLLHTFQGACASRRMKGIVSAAGQACLSRKPHRLQDVASIAGQDTALLLYGAV